MWNWWRGGDFVTRETLDAIERREGRRGWIGPAWNWVIWLQTGK